LNPYNSRVLNALSDHLGADHDTVLSMALDHYTRKINALHLFGKAKTTQKARVLNGTYEWLVESFTPVPKSNIHILIVAHENGERFAFKCGGSDWTPIMNTYTTPGLDGGLAGGRLKLVAHGGRPTKFYTVDGSFPLDPVPLPV
jgi:hypothetical protein